MVAERELLQTVAAAPAQEAPGMALNQTAPAMLREAATLRRWLSRAFIMSILAYVVVVGYLVAEAVMGASKWAPFGVNVPAFIGLVIASEIIITATAVWIFREDAGIWPAAIADGWSMTRTGARFRGLKKILVGAWDVPLVELRLRTPKAVFLGRANRVAALVPLAYALIASAGGAPWGLRSSALVDVGITLAVWAFMELVMIQPETKSPTTVPAEFRATVDQHVAAAVPAVAAPGVAAKRSVYEVRRVLPGDTERIEEIERLKWREQAATAEKIQARLAAFPEGQLAAVHISEVDGVPGKRSLVAWSTVTVADDADVRSFPTWDEVTAEGTIANCKRAGNVVVGVNLTSVTEGAVYLLMGEILANVVEWGKAKLVGGCRLNGYVGFNKRRSAEGLRPVSAREYATLREVRGHRLNEERIDVGLPPLSDEAYMRRLELLRADNGRLLQEDETADYVCSNVRGYLSLPGTRLCAVMPDYFPDASSDNYGVLLEWPNPLPRPLRQISWLQAWVAQRIRSEVHNEWELRKQRLRELAARRAAKRVPDYLRRDGHQEAVPAPVAEPVPVDVEVAAAPGEGTPRA